MALCGPKVGTRFVGSDSLATGGGASGLVILSLYRSGQLQMFAIARRDSDGRVVNGVASVVLAAVLIGTIYVGREVF